MIDKLWYDWQNANPANFWSFGGGSVSVVLNPELNRTFPTGIPPYMNVRVLPTGVIHSVDETLVVLDSDPDGWYFGRLYCLRAYGHSEREVVLHLRVNPPGIEDRVWPEELEGCEAFLLIRGHSSIHHDC